MLGHMGVKEQKMYWSGDPYFRVLVLFYCMFVLLVTYRALFIHSNGQIFAD